MSLAEQLRRLGDQVERARHAYAVGALESADDLLLMAASTLRSLAIEHDDSDRPAS